MATGELERNRMIKGATIGIKPTTKKRFDRLASGFKHDAFVNHLLDLHEGTSLTEQARILEALQTQRAHLLQQAQQRATRAN
jgi:hypothetical protein